MGENAQIRVLLEQEQDFSFRVSFPGSTVAALAADLSPPVGHGDGPDPEMLLLAALGNCLAASLLFALRKFGGEVRGLRAEATAHSMRNDDGRLRIPRVDVDLHVPGLAPDYPKFERVLAQFEQFCTVTQSVRQGIDVRVSVIDGEGRVLKGDRSFEAGS